MNQEYAYFLQKIIRFELDKIQTLKKTKDLLSTEDLSKFKIEMRSSLKTLVKMQNDYKKCVSLKYGVVGDRIYPHFEKFLESSIGEISNFNEKIEQIRVAHALYNSCSKSNMVGVCLVLYGMIVKYGIKDDEIRDFVDWDNKLNDGFNFDDVQFEKVPHENLGSLALFNHKILKSKIKNKEIENLPIEFIPKYNQFKKMAGFKYELKRTLLKNVKLRFRNEKDLNMVAFFLADSSKYNEVIKIVKLRFVSNEKIVLFLKKNNLCYTDTNDRNAVEKVLFRLSPFFSYN